MATTESKRFKIGDVCKQADVQPYVLRYWETEFPPLAPDKTGGGQRTYSQRDIDVILRIKELLYTEGFTIAGAKKKLEAELRDGGEPKTPQKSEPAAPSAAADVTVAASPEPPKGLSPRQKKTLGEIRDDLRALLEMLNA
ncbi:MAG: MerR family transcriptional regulator [Thermoanaerobaculia bacterium]|nr:MerR family transcriptional regulator [Thermoanaerobaculia bacterium]